MKMEINSDYLEYMINSVKSTTMDETVMELYDDRWLIRQKGPANVIMVAMMVPSAQMSHYERAGYEKIGIYLNKVENFISSTSGDIKMWMESRALWMKDKQGAEAKIATIDPALVDGKMENTIKTEFEVTIHHNLGLFSDFITRAEGITGKDSYMISCREEGLYLYMRGDSSTMKEFYEWDAFEDHEIDWSVNNLAETKNSLTPKNDKGIDVIMANDFTESINDLSDEASISLANHRPMKIVYDNLGEEGESPIKISYVQAPRIDKQDWGTLPEEALE